LFIGQVITNVVLLRRFEVEITLKVSQAEEKGEAQSRSTISSRAISFPLTTGVAFTGFPTSQSPVLKNSSTIPTQASLYLFEMLKPKRRKPY
jgi:hypothetical protein